MLRSIHSDLQSAGGLFELSSGARPQSELERQPFSESCKALTDFWRHTNWGRNEVQDENGAVVFLLLNNLNHIPRTAGGGDIRLPPSGFSQIAKKRRRVATLNFP